MAIDGPQSRVASRHLHIGTSPDPRHIGREDTVCLSSGSGKGLIVRHFRTIAVLLVAFIFLPGCSDEEASDPQTAAVATPITITCVPEGGMKQVKNGSDIGPDGQLVDEDDYVPYMLLQDDKRKFELQNHLYGVYVDLCGLDPKKAYTFVIQRDSAAEPYRLLKILDGTDVKFDAAAHKGE